MTDAADQHPVHPARPEAAKASVALRAAAGLLMLAIFALDRSVPVDVATSILYVVPVLLFLRGDRPAAPLVVGAVATGLSVTVLLLATPAPLTHAAVNRGLAIGAVWLTALLLTGHRRAVRDAGAHASVAHAVQYALDQSAIVAFTDARGRITYANDQFCAISRYSREELLGQDHRLLNSRYHPREFMQDLWRTIARGGVWHGELRNRAKDGTLYWVDTTIVPQMDAKGRPLQYLSIRYDITSRKAIEARLLEQASLTQLGELASVVAHEVRNPLAGLRDSLQVLASRLPPDMREKQIIGAMIERIDGLNDKVQDLLLFARPKPPRPGAIDLRPVLAEAVAGAVAAVRPATVSVEVTGVVPAARADGEMLREILLNLLLNACQASPDGGTVEVQMGVRDGRCEIQVRDHGPGIPADLREKVFAPFFTTKRSGTGLGLPIVKRLIELQDGTITLTSPERGGTIATITLPLAASARRAQGVAL